MKKNKLKFVYIEDQKFSVEELEMHQQEMQRLHDIGYKKQIKELYLKI
jgi:hypothetical protein